jgi:hypothetical protein
MIARNLIATAASLFLLAIAVVSNVKVGSVEIGGDFNDVELWILATQTIFVPLFFFLANRNAFRRVYSPGRRYLYLVALTIGLTTLFWLLSPFAMLMIFIVSGGDIYSTRHY